jgi:hypothetical protein
MKELRLIFDDKTFKKLENKKEELKILGKIKNWEEFILKLAKIKS